MFEFELFVLFMSENFLEGSVDVGVYLIYVDGLMYSLVVFVIGEMCWFVEVDDGYYFCVELVVLFVVC